MPRPREDYGSAVPRPSCLREGKGAERQLHPKQKLKKRVDYRPMADGITGGGSGGAAGTIFDTHGRDRAPSPLYFKRSA
jgi:hypothetical protein